MADKTAKRSVQPTRSGFASRVFLDATLGKTRPEAADGMYRLECDLATEGWRKRDWDPKRGRPFALRRPGFHGGHYWENADDGRLLDHCYRLLTPWGGEVFVTEPYGISPEGVLALLRLLDDGWDFEIGRFSLWNPGGTTPVWIWRKDGPGPYRPTEGGDLA